MSKNAYLVYECYEKRDKPLCVITADTLEEAIRITGGEPLGLYQGEFQVHIPLEKCHDSGYRGVGWKNMLFYEHGPIRFEVDPNLFTGGVLALVEVPLFEAA
ncbi:MAG: hypothetical protein HY431_00720 [Candidatus Levybacteria bacterium]|nr:hypothetical protein [Candidatus Ryanbacteria bacterium]MBI4084404.1 hypothetical protein [Candidatus Levybacteria bacterium]